MGCTPINDVLNTALLWGFIYVLIWVGIPDIYIIYLKPEAFELQHIPFVDTLSMREFPRDYSSSRLLSSCQLSYDIDNDIDSTIQKHFDNHVADTLTVHQVDAFSS